MSPTDYTAPAMTDGVTTLDRANVRGWLQGVGDHGDDRAKVIEEGPINIEYFDAVAGAANSGPQIQNACDAYPYGAEIMIPPAKLYNTTQIIAPGTETMIDLRGRVRAMGAVDSLAAIFDFSVPGGKGRQGGIKGPGRLLGNRVAHTLVYVNSWHGASFRDFAVNDQVYAGIHFKVNSTPPSGGAVGVGDSDGHIVHHVMHFHEGGAGFGITTTERPQRFIVFEGGGGAGAGCSDNSVEGNCYVSDGLDGESAPGAHDGGWGIEVINASRIRIKDFGCFDNTRFYSGAVLIHVNTAAGGTQTACVVEDLYAESQAGPPGPDPLWINAAVEIRAESGAAQNTTDHLVSGLKMASTAGGNAKRLWTRLLGAATVGRISAITYKEPRGHLGSAGQILLGAGTSNSLIQTMGPGIAGSPNELAFISPVTPVNGNKYVNLLA